MKDAIFREYDIRGKIGEEFIIDEVYALTCAIAYFFLQENPSVKTVVVGMDGRTHSPAIKEHMCNALMDSGLNVVFIGTVPTPVLYFSLYNLPVEAGLMITASHNPKDYNGIKLCLDKHSVWGLQVQKIKEHYHNRDQIMPTKKGTLMERPMVQEYVAWMKDHFVDLVGYPIKAVIDCANGAGGAVMPDLVKAMEWQNVSLLYSDVDGTYPNHEADPVKYKNMLDVKKVLETTDCQVGIGLDGDADRMAPMTKSGYLVPGDQLLALFAHEVVTNNRQAPVVFDIKSSQGLIEVLTTWGAAFCMSPSGHAIIKDQMKKHGGLLGGELSCHFFFADRYFGYDDGIYALLRLFEILKKSGKSLDELVAQLPQKVSSVEYRIACSEDEKKKVVAYVCDFFAKRDDADTITIDGVRAVMSYGWGIVRASNTQSQLTIRFEADTEEALAQVKRDFIAALEPFYTSQELVCAFEL